MTPKDFFRVVLKIMSILIVTSTVLPMLPTIIFMFGSDLTSAFYMLGMVFLCIGLVYLMLFEVDAIIRIFNLDKGFEFDKFKFSNIESGYIVKIACAIVGLYLITSNIPYLIYEAFVYFKKNVSSSLINDLFDTSEYQLYISVLHFIVGLILIALRNFISNFFDSDLKKNT